MTLNLFPSKSILALLFISCSFITFSQTVMTKNVVFSSIDCYQRANLEDTYIEGFEKVENVYVHKLCSDSLSTAYIIWVKRNVAAHMHAYHSEVIYVLEGRGNMTVGNETFIVGTGDYVFIPMNTVHSVNVISEEPMKVLSIQSPEFKGEDRILVEE